MTQEEKQLLLIDFCARLPYNLYIRVEEFNVSYPDDRITEGFIGNCLKDNRCNDYDTEAIFNELTDGLIDVKPYLRSLSSMTEEERLILREWIFIASDTKGKICFDGFKNISAKDTIKAIDYLTSHHFDFRGLIEKGLALEAPKDMYKTE